MREVRPLNKNRGSRTYHFRFCRHASVVHRLFLMCQKFFVRDHLLVGIQQPEAEARDRNHRNGILIHTHLDVSRLIAGGM